MPLLSYKKKQVISKLPPAEPPRHHLYSDYNRLVHSPPPPPFLEGNRRSFYSKSVQRKFKDIDDIEKYNPQKMMTKEVEKIEKMNKMTCSRLICCLCFPCLPMWTRTICCFIFLLLCGIIGLFTFFIFTFKKPQVEFVGNDRSLSTSLSQDLGFEYNVYNENFFPFNFDSIKAVIYYPTPNKTTIGVAELNNIILGPQTITKITFPVKIITEGHNKTSNNYGDHVFKQLVINSCSNKDDVDTKHQDIVVMFDLMPTIKVYNYTIATLAFTGQETKMSCEKLNLLLKNDDYNNNG